MSKKKYDERAILSILLELYEITKDNGNLAISAFLKEKKISSAFGSILIEQRLLVKTGFNSYRWNTGLPTIYTAIKTIKLVRERHAYHIETHKQKLELAKKQELEQNELTVEEPQNIEIQVVEVIEQEQKHDSYNKFEEDMKFIEEQQQMWKNHRSTQSHIAIEEKVENNIQKQENTPTKEHKISILWGAILIKW